MNEQVEQAGIIRHALEIPMDAPVARVWDALTLQTDAWWKDDFYFGGQPGRMHFEAELGGKLYERAEDGSGIVWYHVVALEPGASITLAGHVAPPYAGPAHATLHLSLQSTGDGTLLHVSETVFGFVGPGLAQSLQSGWESLFEAGLKRYVEAPVRPRYAAARSVGDAAFA